MIITKPFTRASRRSAPWLAVIFSLIMLTSCAPGESSSSLQMLSADALPAQIRTAPAVVVDAYRYAVANPDMLTQVPCYCGCDSMGHQSNYACYVSEVDSSGVPVYDIHALGCSICVDITQDVMRMHKEGKTLGEIRAAIDEIYALYGPSNMPAPQEQP